MLYPTAGKSATAGPPGIDCKPQYSITAPPRKAQNSVSTALPNQGGLIFTRIPDLHPSSRRQPKSGHPPYLPPSPIPTVIPHIYRHSGESRNPGIPHTYRHPPYLPSFRRKPESGHPPYLPSFPISTAIPAIYHPSFRRFTTRHSGESRNLAPPLYSTFRPSNGRPPKPPEKSAIFSDATSLPTVHRCGTLAISKSGNPASGSNVPPKAGPAAQVHGDPSGCVSSPKAKASGE